MPDGVQLAYLAGGGVVRVRFTGEDPAVLAPLADAAAQALGDDVWGRDGDTLAGVVHRLLGAAGATVAVAESLTGGLLGAALSAPSPGRPRASSAGCWSTRRRSRRCSPVSPAALLAEHGAVAEPTARAMAEGVRARTGADVRRRPDRRRRPRPAGGAPARARSTSASPGRAAPACAPCGCPATASGCAPTPSPWRSTCCAAGCRPTRGRAGLAATRRALCSGRIAVPDRCLPQRARVRWPPDDVPGGERVGSAPHAAR